MSNRQYSVLQQVVSEYIGMPSTTGRGAYLAGLAINEEIDNLDSRNFFFMRAFADLTLVSGSVTYSLSTTWPNFKTHIASVLLNAAGTLRERYILYLTPEDFFRAGYSPTILTGSPFYITVDLLADLIRINADPGAAFNGRIIRTMYYKKIARLSVSTGTLGVPDFAEDLVVQGAIWRARRLARLDYDADKRNAELAEKRILANQESVDLASMGLL